MHLPSILLSRTLNINKDGEVERKNVYWKFYNWKTHDHTHNIIDNCVLSSALSTSCIHNLVHYFFSSSVSLYRILVILSHVHSRFSCHFFIYSSFIYEFLFFSLYYNELFNYKWSLPRLHYECHIISWIEQWKKKVICKEKIDAVKIL